MPLGVTDDQNYNDIADAIRSVGVGMENETFTPGEMSSAIRGLRTYWGTISGSVEDQADLSDILDEKANSSDLGEMAEVNDAPTDGKTYGRKNGTWSEVTGGGGGGSSEWGEITGDISDQTDLQTALNAKADKATTYTKTETDTLLNAKADISGLGSLASMDSISYTSGFLTNKPTLGDLASKDKVDYTTDILNVPSFGALALMNSISYESNYLTDKPVFGDLASKDTVDYISEVTNKPSLGTMSAINDAPSDGAEYVRKNGNWAVSSGGGGGGGASWGAINGTLSNQTDLQAALDAKADISSLGDLAAKDSVDWDTDINDIPASFPPSAHTHDDRYYTETEVDTALAGKADIADLGNLASKDTVDYVTEVTNKPSIPSGALASLDSIDYASNYITNKPTIPNGALASLNSIDYTSNYITNKPTIPNGALASLDSIDYTSNYITNKPSIPNGALASLDSIDYSTNYITNKPTLGGIQVRPDYVVSNTDLTPGVSQLETGKLYIYYS